VYVYAVQNDPYPSDIESVELVPDSFVRTREFDAACEKLWESDDEVKESNKKTKSS
jgi:hypothetical protein